MSRRPWAPPRALTVEEQMLLLFHVAPYVRTVTLYVLALRFGLGARTLSALNIGDVSEDGRRPRETLRLGAGTLPLFPPPLGAEVRRTLTRYLAWRCACFHLRHPLRTYRDEAGVERCHACHDDVRTLLSPLFVGRRSRRLSEKRMWNEFAEHRQEADLDPHLRFGCLRLTALEASRAAEER
jgi:hypothetical protein